MASYCDVAPGHPYHGPYHAKEYGFPIRDDSKLFERLALEINQAGLSWLTSSEVNVPVWAWPIGGAVPSRTPRSPVNSRSVVAADIAMASSTVVASPDRETATALQSCASSSFSLASIVSVFIANLQ